jgi:hypothetical protein
MSTIKSSAENLTLNADGSGNDVIIQSNGSTKVTLDGSGNLGIGTGTIANESDHKKLKIAGGSGTGAGMIEFADTSNNIDGAIFADGGNLFIVADRDNATATSSIRFRVDGSSERARITTDGLTFNGDTAAANALDDYEEGTWTVAITMGSGTAAVNSSHNTLSYTKVGRLVTIGGQFRVGSVSSPDGEFKINLPFTSISTDGGSGYCSGTYRAYNIDTPNDGVAPVIHNNVGAADATLQWSRDGSTPTNERATTDGYFMIGLAYMTV